MRVRIVYGIHGYGRGHAMRALAVLPELTRRHEVLVLAGLEAYDALVADFHPVRIPVLTYAYNRSKKICHYRTGWRNAPLIIDAFAHGPTLRMVQEQMRRFATQVVMYDSEVFTAAAARSLGIPTISFDHFGLLHHCRLQLPTVDRITCAGQCAVYRMLYGKADRAIVTSFFPAPAKHAGVAVVGSVIRPEARQLQPSAGGHLLAYFSQADREYTDSIDAALRDCGAPVIVYGTSRRGVVGTIEYKPIANRPFLQDLASCRAVIATTGNQLLTEVMHFRKPMLALPIDCLEQRLNAAQVSRWGVGVVTTSAKVTRERVREFLARVPEFAARFPQQTASGAADAVMAIERFAAELVGRPAPV